MPFSASDAATFKKGLSPKQARQWAAVANSVLKKCAPPAGASPSSSCEGSAIRQASGAVKAAGEVAEKDMHLIAPHDATTFEQADQFTDLIDRVHAAQDQLEAGMTIIRNAITEGGDLSGLLDELDTRVGNAIHGRENSGHLPGRDKDKDKSLGSKLRGLLPGRSGPSPAMLPNAPPPPEDFLLSKDADDRMRATMLVSLNVEDRDGETLARKGQWLNVAAINASGVFPEFWAGHVPGTRWGVADYADVLDDVFVVSGPVDVGAEPVAEALAAKAADLGVSHGFAIMDRNTQDPSVVERWFTYEVSPLLRSKAALPMTAVMIDGGD